MGIHTVHYNDETGDLVEVDYQCSARCMGDELEHNGISVDGIDPAGTLPHPEGGTVEYGAWPCGSETDYDVYCSACGVKLWDGLVSV